MNKTPRGAKNITDLCFANRTIVSLPVMESEGWIRAKNCVEELTVFGYEKAAIDSYMSVHQTMTVMNYNQCG